MFTFTKLLFLDTKEVSTKLHSDPVINFTKGTATMVVINSILL